MAQIHWIVVVSAGIAGLFGLCCLFDGARRIALYGANAASGYLIGIGAALCLALAGFTYWKSGGQVEVELVMWLVWGVAALLFGMLFAREPSPGPVADVDADTITIVKVEPVLAPPAVRAPPPVAASAAPAASVAPAAPAAPVAAKPASAPPPAAPPPKRAISEDTVPLRKPAVGGDTVPLPKPRVGEDTVPLPKPGIPPATMPLARPASVGEDTVPLAKPAPGAFTPPKKE
jgi:hypothetical protein